MCGISLRSMRVINPETVSASRCVADTRQKQARARSRRSPTPRPKGRSWRAGHHGRAGVRDYVQGRHKLRATSRRSWRMTCAAAGAARGLTGAAAHKSSHRRAGDRSRRGRHEDRQGSYAAAVGRRSRSTRSSRRSARCSLTPAPGFVARNVAEHVDPVAARPPVSTPTPRPRCSAAAAIANDRLGHAWELALSGLRRGEIAGLRWSDVDLDGKTAVDRQQPGERGRPSRRERSEVGDVAADPAAA